MNLGIGDLVKAYSAWESAKVVALGKVDHTTLNSFAKMFEYDLPVEQGDAIISLLKNEDPNQFFGDFIQGGGLFRLVTAQKGGQARGPSPTLIRCPHCQELHVTS